MDWPYLTQTSGPSPDASENQYFTIEGNVRNHYVDFPNHLVDAFFSKILHEVPEAYPNDPESQYKAALEVTERYNEALDEMGLDFLQLRIVDRSSSRPHPYYGLQIHGLDSSKFDAFLDSFAETDETTLEEKYHYVHGSKYPVSEVASKSHSDSIASRKQVQEAVKARVESEKDSITKTTETLLSRIDKWRDELQTYWRRTTWQRFNTFPAVHLYLLEMESIITNIDVLADRGSIPPCYRELRKLLENLSWSVFDDLLFINAEYATIYDDSSVPPHTPPRPFLSANQQWYNWVRGRQTPSFETQRSQLRDRLYDHSTRSRLSYDDKYGITKGTITEVLKTNLSYPLYIALAGLEVETTESVESFVTPVNPAHLKPGVRRTIQNVVRSLKEGRRLGQLDEEFIDTLTDELLDIEANYLVPPFPSNNHVIGYLDSLWHHELPSRLDDFYGEYSFFIHSYPSSWQIHPHSSILEFKILAHEIDRFSHAVSTLIEQYLTTYHRN